MWLNHEWGYLLRNISETAHRSEKFWASSKDAAEGRNIQ